jgi:hypothetical protein
VVNRELVNNTIEVGEEGLIKYLDHNICYALHLFSSRLLFQHKCSFRCRLDPLVLLPRPRQVCWCFLNDKSGANESNHCTGQGAD